jgi:tetratricopeptide (TPR) repeat protein
MWTRGAGLRIWFAAGLLAAGLFLPAAVSAQSGRTAASGSVMDNQLSRTDSTRASEEIETAYLNQTLGDPKEEAAYRAFHNTNENLDKKIKLGNAFLAKYPADRYSEAVYEELAQTYYNKKDLANFYNYSDKGLQLFPDDVHMLALSGWVIPRAFTPDEPDADKKLEKAESQERHALEVIGKMEKPASFTDEQFTQFKTGESAVAHSGLGVVYFRREKYDESAKELQAAIPGEANPDQTDFMILGADLENLGQFREAADAFNRCAQITGGMQDRCKQYAADATKRAGEAK